MILKELYSLIGVASSKVVDTSHTNQTVSTFPRHPLATQSSPGSHVMPVNQHHLAMESSYYESAMTSTPAFTSELPVPRQSSSNMAEFSLPSAVLPLGPTMTSPTVAPPPKSGFVRK
jgi:hypothetical protein